MKLPRIFGSLTSGWSPAARRYIGATALGLVCVVVWLSFAPRQVGGPVSYVVTSGISMEPMLHAGDLAVVRERDSYRVGDVVAFYNKDLKRVVLHRILKREGELYVFKGDNNDFIDSYRASREDLIGELWIKVPAAGKVLTGSPLLIAILTVLGTFAGLRQAKRKGKKAHQKDGSGAPTGGASGGFSPRTIVIVAVASVALFALLSVVSFARPVRGVSSSSLSYSHNGVFSYSAEVPDSAVYEDSVKTGDPIFLKLVKELDVKFDYHLEATDDHSLQGTYELRATVRSPNGWAHSLLISPQKEFSGDKATVTGSLDLAEIREIVRQVEIETGVVQTTHTVTIRPRIAALGAIKGVGLDDDFSPTLTFQMDALQLQLPTSDPTNAAPPADPFKHTESGSLSGSTQAESTFGVGPLALTVRIARVVSLFGLVMSLVALFMFGLPVIRAMREDEASRILARYGGAMVPVKAVELRSDSALVELQSIESLVRIGERFDLPVLHASSAGVHDYMVESDGALYRYRSGSSVTQPDSPTPAEEAPRQASNGRSTGNGSSEANGRGAGTAKKKAASKAATRRTSASKTSQGTKTSGARKRSITSNTTTKTKPSAPRPKKDV